MDDGPDDLVLIDLRRLDAKMDRIVDDLADVKVRLTNLEEGVAAMGRPDVGLERIERRLDLVDMPH